MNKEYSLYLENLKGRRFDEVLNESVYSEEFLHSNLPDPVKYTLEAMREVDVSYSYKLYSSIRRTQDLITQNLKKLNMSVDARYAGPHATDTHIELFGELELLMILKSYSDKPSKSVEKLAILIQGILSDAMAYDKIDYLDKRKIKILTRQPVCSVSIVPCIWVESSLYKESSLEINRSVCEFDFINKTRKLHLPFLNIARVNAKDRKVNGALKSMIRLLRSLQQDSNKPIKLSHDEIAGICFGIPIKELAVPSNQFLSILPNVSLELGRIIKDDNYRERMLSPSRKEFVFGKKPKKPALEQLKIEVDELIDDLRTALKSNGKTLLSPLRF
jgi:hypothetical protein